MMMRRGETTRTSRNDAKMFQDAEQRRAELHARVAAWETDIKRFSKDIKKRPEVYSMSQVDDVVNEGDSADWHQLSTSRSNAHQNHDKASSKSLSSAGSGASQSLDGRNKDRDMAIAELEAKEAKLRLLQMDARVGPNGREIRRRPRRCDLMNIPRCPVLAGHVGGVRPRERSLRGTLGDNLEMDKAPAVPPLNDSRATMQYYSPRESRSHGSTSVGDASSAAPNDPRADVVRKAPREIDTRAVV
jgi:hypothetical protein